MRVFYLVFPSMKSYFFRFGAMLQKVGGIVSGRLIQMTARRHPLLHF